LVKSKEHEIERMKKKIEKFIDQDMKRPLSERQRDQLEEDNSNLTKRCYILQKNKEVHEREVEELRKELSMKIWDSQPVEEPKVTVQSDSELVAKIGELESCVERERTLREATEAQLLEQRRVLEQQVTMLLKEVEEGREKLRHRTYDLSLMQEVQRLRDVEFEGRRRWKAMNPRDLMRRDKQLQHLQLLKQDFGLSRDEAIDIIKEMLRILKRSSIEEMFPALEKLVAAKEIERLEATCQTEDSISEQIFQLLETTSLPEACHRIEKLKMHASSLQRVARQIGCSRLNNIVSEIDRLMLSHDKQQASAKIVETLQSFLNVPLECILPAVHQLCGRQESRSQQVTEGPNHS